MEYKSATVLGKVSKARGEVNVVVNQCKLLLCVLLAQFENKVITLKQCVNYECVCSVFATAWRQILA